ncbi:hypothetical protein NDU88_007197 [Pleurodeles waltl]|uniref:Uncharacterized protein n=1 Tax=Pleurodeles waltl TaxID=8319 RepID=A0AAV7LX13_PLEWA|nr:hypothetical protein NDU88_007197 [Pleurodeles waltl]
MDPKFDNEITLATQPSGVCGPTPAVTIEKCCDGPPGGPTADQLSSYVIVLIGWPAQRRHVLIGQPRVRLTERGGRGGARRDDNFQPTFPPSVIFPFVVSARQHVLFPPPPFHWSSLPGNTTLIGRWEFVARVRAEPLAPDEKSHKREMTSRLLQGRARVDECAVTGQSAASSEVSVQSGLSDWPVGGRSATRALTVETAVSPQRVRNKNKGDIGGGGVALGFGTRMYRSIFTAEKRKSRPVRNTAWGA